MKKAFLIVLIIFLAIFFTYYENCSENMLTNILKQLDDISGDKKRLINNRED